MQHRVFRPGADLGAPLGGDCSLERNVA